jgi:hypothetical protein
LRQEAKEVDGFELEKAEERKRESELVEDDEEQLYDLDGKPAFERELDHASVVAAAMQRILEREHIVIDVLGLDRREQRALEALKTAVEGRDQDIHAFVFAEDRRALLEQALAVLQPNLARLGGELLHTLVKEVAELRHRLDTLEDAQEEAEHRDPGADTSEASDTDDKPEPDDDAFATETERAKPQSSLTGPEREPEPKPQSSLTGPGRTPEPKPQSSLTGPEREPEPKPQSSLTGPELPEPKKPPTSLGDPEEIAAAVRPWWRSE